MDPLRDATRQARYAAYRFETDTAIDRRGAMRALGAYLDYTDSFEPSERAGYATRIMQARFLLDRAYILEHAKRLDLTA